MRLVPDPRLPLNVLVRRADRPGMLDLEPELVAENPSWIAVLKAYQKAQEELAARQAEEAAKSAQAEKFTCEQNAAAEETALPEDGEARLAENENAPAEEADGKEGGKGSGKVPKKRPSRWVSRITKVSGIDSEELSKIHGRLIAYDLLKCDLAGRSDGMVYQLTTSGKTIINRFGEQVEEEVEVEDRSAA